MPKVFNKTYRTLEGDIFKIKKVVRNRDNNRMTAKVLMGRNKDVSLYEGFDSLLSTMNLHETNRQVIIFC